MTTQTRSELWQQLTSLGLAQGQLPGQSETRAPWYVRVMMGFGGWLGALFLFGFVGALFAFVMKNAFAAIAVGGLLCAGATALFRAQPKGDFAGQFALAMSLAGQVMIAYGFSDWLGMRKVWPVSLAMAGVQAGLFVLVPNFIHRALMAWSAAFLAAIAMGDLRLHPFTPALVTAGFAWVWIREFDFAGQGAAARAGGYGLAFASMQVTVMHGELWTRWLLEKGGGPVGGELGLWLGAFASALVLLWAVVLLLRREGLALDSAQGRIALIGAAILGAASLKAPGIGPSVAILVVGYANGNRVLAGLGILALLGYLSHFYYALHATLLVKAAILSGTGVALLLARLAVHQFWPAAESKEVSHA